MSNFNRLSQAIGTAVHKATKNQIDLGDGQSIEFITNQIMYDLEFRHVVKQLVEHTVNNIEDNKD